MVIERQIVNFGYFYFYNSAKCDASNSTVHSVMSKTKGKSKCDMHFIVADVEIDRHRVQPIRMAAQIKRVRFDQSPSRARCAQVR